MKANFYTKLEDSKVQCCLCPHNCIIGDGKSGICRVRYNKGGELIAETYQKYSALNFDPIEKKPLYHFYPGKEILSLGSVGCNMQCKWCQNCEISQTGVGGSRELKSISSENILQMAVQRPQNIGLAYTYNEPSISYESISEVARLAHQHSLKNVMVTNGFLEKQVMIEYLNFIDAFNIDVKAFDEKIHKKFTGAELQPVLDNLKRIRNTDRHLELTFLIVPGVNDDYLKFAAFIQWVDDNLGADTILHISRYFPRYQMKTNATPPFILEKFADLASDSINYVYVGNSISSKFNHTYCPSCKSVVIRRMGFSAVFSTDPVDGNCPNCGRKIVITD